MKLKWVDISVPLQSRMVLWPGDPFVKIEQSYDVEAGDPYTVSAISMGSHTGTHIDAPRHFIRGGVGIDGMPLEAMIGPARVISIHDPESVKFAELKRHRIRQGERILFKTLNSIRCWKVDHFIEDFVYISQNAAEYLVTQQVLTVGIDYLSVDSFKKGGIGVHQLLLEGGVWIIEGLDLSRVKPGKYELICLPLNILKADASPARAVLRNKGFINQAKKNFKKKESQPPSHLN